MTQYVVVSPSTSSSSGRAKATVGALRGAPGALVASRVSRPGGTLVEVSPPGGDADAPDTPDEIAALGQAYLDSTRIQRQSDRPLFIDKMPNNFQHVGLIATILPNAKIIDARRHPMGGCFAGFKQHFARGQNFSYSLEDIGRYYADYVELMAHYDKVLPGRVHRVFYEDMVADSETQIRALLERCLERARLEHLITSNPAAAVKPPKRRVVKHVVHLLPQLGACLLQFLRR